MYTANKNALVISGGGVSGLVILGKMTELGFRPSSFEIFSGTSVGSIIAYGMSIGVEAVEMYEMLYTSDVWTKLTRVDLMNILSRTCIFDIALVRREIEKMSSRAYTFRDIEQEYGRTLNCVAYNMSREEMVYFNPHTTPDMKVVDALILSCAIPFLFAPQYYDGDLYVDGGLADNLPIEYTMETFRPSSGIAIRCLTTREAKRQAGENWTIDHVLGLVVACARMNATKQISKYPEVKLVNVFSSIPFYDMGLDKRKIMRLFASGFSSLESAN